MHKSRQIDWETKLCTFLPDSGIRRNRTTFCLPGYLAGICPSLFLFLITSNVLESS
jgi:hypothetical protein